MFRAENRFVSENDKSLLGQGPFGTCDIADYSDPDDDDFERRWFDYDRLDEDDLRPG